MSEGFIIAGIAGSGGEPYDLVWAADAAGAVLPTDGSTALDAGFKSVGRCDDSGFVTGTAISSTDITSFGLYSPSRTLIQGEVLTVRFTTQETNKVTQAIKTRQALSAVTVTIGAMSLTRGPARDALYAIVAAVADGSNIVRKVYPLCRLTALGDEAMAKSAPLTRDFTLTAYPDASGNAEYEYDVITGLT